MFLFVTDADGKRYQARAGAAEADRQTVGLTFRGTGYAERGLKGATGRKTAGELTDTGPDI